MIRRILNALHLGLTLDYCEKCGWWTKPQCGH